MKHGTSPPDELKEGLERLKRAHDGHHITTKERNEARKWVRRWHPTVTRTKKEGKS